MNNIDDKDITFSKNMFSLFNDMTYFYYKNKVKDNVSLAETVIKIKKEKCNFIDFKC